MKRLFTAFFLCFLIIGFESKAEALSAYSYSTFSFNDYDMATDFIGVDPFDPNLGTLQDVVVSIYGSINVSAFLSPAQTDFYGNIISSSPYFIELNQTFDGLFKYFDFVSPAKFNYTGENFSPYSELIHIASTFFNYGFKFDESTDLLGGNVFPSFSSTATLVPPTSIFGFTADFYETLLPINEIDLIMYATGYGYDSILLQGGGTITMEYVYEPAPVPEPSAILLLGSGLLGLGWYGRKRKK